MIAARKIFTGALLVGTLSLYVQDLPAEVVSSGALPAPSDGMAQSLIAPQSPNSSKAKKTVRPLSQLTEQEKEWYQKFHSGVFLFDGWEQITNEVLLKLPEDIHAEKKQLLKSLGEKIGSEWCKKNEVRRINNKMLMKWGDQLEQAMSDGPAHIVNTLKKIETDVNKILLY